jgi:CelD/BcsL family acetyltransferase involved in cellulose biosynthesis
VVIDGAEALERLSPEWDGLLERSYDNRLFLSSQWQQIWWRHFGRGSLYVLTYRDEDELLGILPLHLDVEAGTRTLTLAGDWNLSDYMDGLAERVCAGEILTELWRTALSDLPWDRIALRHVPSTSPLIPALQSVALEEGVELSVEPDEVCPVALLCSNWEGYLQMLGKKQRHEVRRKLRRATEAVEWEWRTAHSPEDLDRELPVFFRLHEAAGGDKAGFMTSAVKNYFRDLAHALLDRGILRLSVFRRAGEDIAATMSFHARNRYFLYNSGYDPAAAAYSPGIAAVAFAMQDAIADKAVAFDFLSGDEPYKYQLGAANTYTCRIETGT